MYGGSVRSDCEVPHHLLTTCQQGTTMSHIESVPTTWDEVLDVQFFRIVSHVLPPHVLEAASALLGANDADLAPYA
jgi:hypothetical protein